MTFPVMTEGTVRQKITANLDDIIPQAAQSGDWSAYWRYMVTVRNMERASAFGQVEGLARAAVFFPNREDWLRQIESHLDIDRDTSSRYIRTWEMYDREDFQDLDPQVRKQLQDLPIQWQIRVMQNTSDGVPITAEFANAVIGSSSLKELNNRLRERRGIPAKGEGRSWSISPDGSFYSWFNGDLEGSHGVWTGPNNIPAYDEFKKKLGIEHE